MGPDAIVIGAGIIGASIALRLMQAGLRVTLLDRGTMGAEASWAGAGMLAPGGEIRERSPWSDFALESLRLYPEFVRELEELSGCSIDYRQSGALELAFTDGELRELEARAEAQRALGIESRQVQPAAAGLPVAGAVGIRFFPEDAVVNPRDVMHALRTACRNVAIREGVQALGIEADATGVSVSTTEGTLEGGSAILAAGAWSSAVLVSPDVRLPETYPVRGHLLGFRVPPGTLPHIVRSGHTYLFERRGGYLVAGASSEDRGFDRTIDPDLVRRLHADAARILPMLGELVPTDRWLGFRPATRSGAPVIGRAGTTRLWLAYGHYRNGILLAPATARRIAGEVTQIR